MSYQKFSQEDREERIRNQVVKTIRGALCDSVCRIEDDDDNEYGIHNRHPLCAGSSSCCHPRLPSPSIGDLDSNNGI